MKYYVNFVDDEGHGMLGTSWWIIVDGRLSKDNALLVAYRELERKKVIRGYVSGFKLYHAHNLRDIKELDEVNARIYR